MRKHIISLFLSLCPTMAMAATNAECQESYISNDDKCILLGCGYYDNKCIACPAGTYQDQTPALDDLLLSPGKKCNDCTPPWQFDTQSINWSWDISKTGMVSPVACTIHVPIPKGYELIEKQNISQYTVQECADNHYKTESTTLTYTLTDQSNPYPDIPLPTSGQIPDDAKCKKCGNFATHNNDHTNCDCNYGYSIEKDINNTENVGSENCFIIEFAATYSDDTNTLDNEDVPTQYQTIHLTPKYPLTLPKIDCNQPSINGIPQSSLCMTKTGYNFDDKWTADKKLNVCNPGQCLGEIKAGSEIAVNATATLTADDMGDVTFTAVWKAKEFTVKYYNDNSDKPYYEQECTYGTTCSAYDAPTPTDPTKYFAGWKCRSGCRNTATLYQTDEDISKISDGNDMELTAQWETCPAGHYCTNNTVNPCPAGSTSDGGKTQITDCYINENTQFCDSNGDNCFNIEDKNFKIQYSGS